MKKMLAIILTAVMLFTALPMTAYAADADTAATGATIIDSVAVTIDPPAAGESPSYTAAVPEGAGYMVDDYTRYSWQNGVCWLDSEGDAIRSDDSFYAGEKYTVEIMLVPTDSSYAFADSLSELSATVNGAAAQIDDDAYFDSEGKRLYVRYTFTCPEEFENTVIDFVAVTIDPPVAGEKPSYTAAVPEGAGYMTADYNLYSWQNGVCWLDSEGDAIRSDDSFYAGEKYTVKIMLVPTDSSYAFPIDPYELSATINGAAAQIDDDAYYDSEGKRLYVQYTFTCPEEFENTVIDFVAVTIAPPVAGEKPSYTATIPEGMGYMVEDYTATWYKNGVLWKVENGNLLSPDSSVFRAGMRYTVLESLVPVDDSYAFADEADLSGTLNGEDATVGVFSAGKNIFVRYTFTCPGEPDWTTIDTVAVTIDSPVAGEQPSYTASVPEGMGYMVEDYNLYSWQNGVCWLDADGDPIDPDSSFYAGEQYTVAIRLVPTDSTYAFADSLSELSATVNGKTATIDSEAYYDSDGEKLYVQYTFTCEEPGYTVSFASNGGSGSMESVTGLHAGDTYTLPDCAFDPPALNEDAPDGYYFLYWNASPGYYFAGSEMTITGDVVLTAVWREAVYVDVEFRTDYGTAPDPQRVLFRGYATQPADLTSEGRIFLGWYANPYTDVPFDFGEQITGDTIIWAKWELIEYDVTLSAGENGTASLSSDTATMDSVVSVTAAPDEGYEIDQITYTPAGGTPTNITKSRYFIMPAADVTVSVTFKPVKAAILGDADGDGTVTSVDVTYIQRSIARINTGIAEDVLMNGDVDGNGKLEITDATYIQRFLAKMETSYAIGKAK